MIAHVDLVQFFDGSTWFRWRGRLWKQYRLGEPVWCMWCERAIHRGELAYRPLKTGPTTRICLACIDELLADQPPAPYEAAMKEQDDHGRGTDWRADPPKRKRRT